MKIKNRHNTGMLRPHPKLEALLLSCIIVLLVCCLSFLIYNKSNSILENEIKIGLLSNVSAAATTINGDLHRTFNHDTSRQDPKYLAAAEPLEKIREASQNVRYIYTTILKGDQVYFIINPSPQNDNDGDGKPDLPPALMEQYENPAPELIEALKDHKSVVTNPYQDRWGTFISGYAPFYDSKGQFVGVLGMDLQLHDFYQRVYPIKLIFEKTAIIVFFIGLIIALLTWFSRRYTDTVIQKNNQLTDNKSHFEEELNTETGHYRLVIETVEQTMKSMPILDHAQGHYIEQWLSAWNDYFQCGRSEDFDQENFYLDIMLNHVSQSTSDIVKLEIEQDATVPNYLYGSSTQYKSILSELVGSLHRIRNDCNVMRVLVELKHEQVEAVSVTVSVLVDKHDEFSCTAPIFRPDFDSPERYSVQQIEFFSTVAWIEGTGATIEWVEDNAHQGYRLTFTVSKYREIEQ